MDHRKAQKRHYDKGAFQSIIGKHLFVARDWGQRFAFVGHARCTGTPNERSTFRNEPVVVQHFARVTNALGGADM